MNKDMLSWVLRAAIGLTVGLVMGVSIGWGLWPVEYTNTSPAELRRDYRDDYVVMVATAYEVDGDLAQAKSWLAQLNSGDPAAAAVALAVRLVEANGNAADIARLARLAQALGASLDGVLAPFVEQPQ